MLTRTCCLLVRSGYLLGSFKPSRGINVFWPTHWQNHDLVLNYYSEFLVEFDYNSVWISIASF